MNTCAKKKLHSFVTLIKINSFAVNNRKSVLFNTQFVSLKMTNLLK